METKEKNKGGRPVIYTKELQESLCIEICDRIASGEHIFKILESDERFPAWSTFRLWKRENVALSTMYINAQQDKADAALGKIAEYQEQVREGTITASVANVLIQTEKWKAAKFYPKMFGNKTNVDLTSGGKEVTQQVTVFNLPNNGRDQVENVPEDKVDEVED